MDNQLHPSQSPERGLPHIFRSRSKKNSSTTSLNSDAPSNPERSGLRASVDRGIDKLRDKALGGGEAERTSSADSGGRLSKLVSKRPKRRKKNGDGSSLLGKLNGSRADGPPGSPLKESHSKLNLHSRNASTESFDKSGGSSLMTEDSDSETPATRPALESRSSHAEYLTFTSPLVAAATIDDSAPTSDQLKQDASLSLAPQLASDAAAFDSARSAKATALSKSHSPIDKVRGAFPSSSKPGGSAAGRAVLEKNNTIPRKELSGSRPDSSSRDKPPISPISTSSFPQERPGTPSTFITPPTPVHRGDSPPKRNPKRATVSSLGSLSTDEGSLPAHGPSPTPKDPLHRRARSSTAASTASVLTPQPEEVKTPGGTLITPSGSSGFFSSVFSATQNAVNQISSLANVQAPGQRSRSGTGASGAERLGSAGGEEVVVANQGPGEEAKDEKTGSEEPALATLGTGNLSLTHLGITEGSRDPSAMATKTETIGDYNRSRSSTQNDSLTARSEEASAAEAVSAAYSKPSSDNSVPLTDDRTARPRSIASTVDVASGDATPPRTVTNDTVGSSIIRSGSVRSKISGPKKRGRNSSGATGGAIAVALSASHSALAHPASGLSDRRPTGFAVASSKRNKEFHQTFRSVPEDDYLVEDYSAALQREILLQGRFYVSEKHICFSSNILGWVTNLVISFDEVVAMEKKSTAMIFPNAIIIQTLHAKHVFASFMNRDPTYDILISIWKVGHPNLKSSDGGHTLDENADEKVELAESPESGADSGDDSEDDEDGQSDEHGDAASDTGAHTMSAAGSEAGDTVRVVSTKPPQPILPSATGPNVVVGKIAEALPAAAASAIVSDFPGPVTHAPSECTDQDSHYDKIALDTTIPAPLGKVHSMMFGALSGSTMKRFLVDDQKSTDLQLDDDKKGLGDESKTLSYSYIKPLSGSIGPKQTKCIVTSVLDAFELERAVSVTCSTQTPDVPSGNVFVTKTRYCLMWGPGNTTRILMTCTVEWSGKSWIKGPIEKGAADGQVQHGKDLAAFLKSQLAAKSPTKVPRGKVKGKKRKATSDATAPSGGVAGAAASASGATSSSWGPLEPLHAILGPAGDILAPLMTTTGILAILLVFVSTMWMRQSWRGGPAVGNLAFPEVGSPQRLAAYEQLWKREENHLWDWLEDRLNLDGVMPPPPRGEGLQKRMRSAEHGLDGSLGADKMSERQVDDAIRVTEERLGALKEMVESKKASKNEEVGS